MKTKGTTKTFPPKSTRVHRILPSTIITLTNNTNLYSLVDEIVMFIKNKRSLVNMRGNPFQWKKQQLIG
jgi:hypothetical protein